MMDKQNANHFSLKPSEAGGQRRQLQYSVETPYGFHLDLDFLKYVDDIEKGNTIRRIHIQRRSRTPKFSTLPRNFSLPSQSYHPLGHQDVWTCPGSLGSKGGNGIQVFDFQASDSRYTGCSTRAEDDAKLRAFDEQPLGLHIRPHLLRASSMPVSILQRKNSELSDDLGLLPGRDSDTENGSTENVFNSSHEQRISLHQVNASLQQQLSAALQKIHELEEQVQAIPKLRAKICTLQKENNLEEQFCLQTAPHNEYENTSPDMTKRELEENLEALEKKLIESQQELVKANALLREQRSVNQQMELKWKKESGDIWVKRVDVQVDPAHTLKSSVSGKESLGVPLHIEEQEKDLVTAGTQTDSIQAQDAEVSTHIPTAEKNMEAVVTVCHRGVDTASSSKTLLEGEQGPIEPATHGDGSGEITGEPNSTLDTDSSVVAQHVSRIQGLLKEQWAFLLNDHPGCSSKVSAIHTQLVGSLNSLYSLCMLHKTDAPQKAAPKSIMKKNSHPDLRGSARAKKNLKFVGVNGGYETTSSEESSEDETEQLMSAEEIVAEPAGAQAQVVTSSRKEVKEDFVGACRYLKEHHQEVTTPDKEMRQAITVLYQEWFDVSSGKDSQADVVGLYLGSVRATAPELLDYIVNLADGNGNTALHYSVSHSNFRIVAVLLDTGLCEVDRQNKAGYTAVMLASLAVADEPEDMEVARRLITLGDVDAQASQAGQTALMLAVSHGRTDMVRLLLACGANASMQDRDGTTALMCACELGHTNIARLLLEQGDCNVSLLDKDGQSALSLAEATSHTQIVDLLKAHKDARAPHAATAPPPGQ